MKSFCFTLLALFLLLTAGSVDASHIFGAHHNYECINNCTLEVKLSLYRDCTGTASLGNTNPVFSSSQPGCTNMPVPIIPSMIQSLVEMTPVCPGTPTNCSNPSATINGFTLHTYSTQIDICSASPNCLFDLTYSTCCRNGAITTVTNAATNSIFIRSTINTGFAACNNLPEFRSEVNTYYCEGDTLEFNLGAFDADGDSLSFSLASCYTASNTPVAYNANFSPGQPFGPDWVVTLDSVSGNFRAVPNPGNIMVPIVCVLVQEWRNGAMIGENTRDIMITLIPCPGNSTPQFTAITNASSWIQANGNVVTVPVGIPFSFDLTTFDADATQINSLYWDQNLSGATFADANNSIVQDSITGNNITGRFTFTAPSDGIYQFTVFLKDNSCPINALQTKVITIEASSANVPDILGQALTSLNAPLPNQRIYLIKHDTVLQSLTAVDSTFTDGQGYFSFSNIQDSILYVKAAPDSALFPNEMPTYADTAIFYTGARAMSVVNAPYNFTFSTRPGGNPGGPGFIGGLISQGANKANGPGDPVIGLRVFLVDSATNAIYGYTETDANGYFSFPDVLVSTFKIIPDQAGVSTDNVPHVRLSLASLSQDSIEFLLQSTHLERKPEIVTGLPDRPDFSWSVSPNPVSNRSGGRGLVLRVDLPADEALRIRLLDLQGREILLLDEKIFKKGQQHIPLTTAPLSEGIYILELKVAGQLLYQKILVGS